MRIFKMSQVIVALAFWRQGHASLDFVFVRKDP
jgi:hypothetical protein